VLTENRQFNNEWTQKYAFIVVDANPVCCSSFVVSILLCTLVLFLLVEIHLMLPVNIVFPF